MDEYVDWGDVESELLERLGFCGCGLPDAALLLIHDLLSYIELFRSHPYNGPLLGPEWEKRCKEDEDALKKVINDNPDGVKYCLFYLVAAKDITCHGGSVPGWIEDYAFRDKLKSYIEFIN